MPISNNIPVVRNASGGVVPSHEALAKMGPLVQILVSAPDVVNKKLAEEGKEIFKPVKGGALIDTGCTLTSVDRGVIKRLGVPQVGTAKVSHADGVSEVTVHVVNLEFPTMPGPPKWQSRVLSCDLRAQTFDVLIGWDVLSKCVFVTNGPLGCWTLAY